MDLGYYWSFLNRILKNSSKWIYIARHSYPSQCIWRKGINRHYFANAHCYGSTAWSFFIINLTKVPLQIFIWQNISAKSISVACVMIPAIVLGALLGVVIIKRLNERFFRYVVIAITAVAAVRLFI
ncbi:TSUP family transporter [Desulfosporosinus sp. SB140]|uniref:TSUP family transporter n=1 Tax=Desulfosporosinus paludis TaxID=3115649 RepID=UPI00388EB327